MFSPSPEIIQLLATFAPCFTRPTYRKVLTLLYGAILTPGKRTISAALRVLGLEDCQNFGKYHRVLNQAIWSPMRLSRLLLGLLIETFAPEGETLHFVVDETLERRRGKRIVYKGWFKDAARSTGNKVVVSQGIRWSAICLLARVPWSSRQWALPFLAVPVLSEKTCKRLNKSHRSGVQWTLSLVKRLRSWLPEREMRLVGDGGYSCVALVAACQQFKVELVSRLRLDAQLHAFPPPQPTSKRGPKPQKGVRLPSLADLAQETHGVWCETEVAWYGGGRKAIGYRTGVCLWYTQGQSPVPIRWVLVRTAHENAKTGRLCFKYAAFFSSEVAVSAESILGFYLQRWNIEVTFEEIRAHLGFETQRHWSKRAVERTTPCLFGLFSLVVLMAQRLHPSELPLCQSEWYRKEEATFSDAMRAVKRHLWGAMNYTMSEENAPQRLIPERLWCRLHYLLANAA